MSKILVGLIIDLTYITPKLFLYLSGYMLSTFVYPAIIDNFLNRFPKLKQVESEKDDDSSPSDDKDVEMGRMIGILERIMLLTAVFSEKYSLIPRLLTAKSIVRFPEVAKGKHFAEYYLIGTLTSFILALLTGIIIKEYSTLV